MTIVAVLTNLTAHSQISLETLLQNMKDVSTLPQLEDSHAAMSSTWDRSGGNNDDADFKDVQGRANILLDTDGPGSISRIFTGSITNPPNQNVNFNRTRLQIFIDHDTVPVIDQPFPEFFKHNALTTYPFVFGTHHSTYPGFLLPIPFNKHIKVQLYSKDQHPVFKNWGNYWQVTYTKYDPETDVHSFSTPLSSDEKKQMDKTGTYLKQTEDPNFTKPKDWDIQKTLHVTDNGKASFALTHEGLITALKASISPNQPEMLKAVRFQIYWDDAPFPSVDAPLGYFFGNADYASEDQYGSLLMGVDDDGGYTRFPMPFRKKAEIVFSAPDSITIDKIDLKLNYSKKKVPQDDGYFHTTWTEEWATAQDSRPARDLASLNVPNMPKYGPKNIPFHTVLDRRGVKGKYVGTMLHVAWPGETWWGEGDWLVWSDEDNWPPRYHGTGTEEYFNSGWCEFDHKATSGYVHKDYPGNVIVYSFHTIDAFNFNHFLKTGVERWNLNPKDDQQKNIWGSTAFWYTEYPVPAESKTQLLSPRFTGDDWD